MFGTTEINSVEDLDRQLSLFVQSCYDKSALGRSYELAKHALLSVQHRYRHLQRRLPRAWDGLKTWWLELPTSLRVPIPPEVAKALFLWALAKAFLTDPVRAREWAAFAVGVKFLREFMARPGELFLAR
jgi:hypothetical protein